MGKSILGPEPGISLLLFVLCGLSLWAYWREKTKNDSIADERLSEAREDTRTVMEALNEANSTIKEFKISNDALCKAFESLSLAARDGHSTAAALISKIGNRGG